MFIRCGIFGLFITSGENLIMGEYDAVWVFIFSLIFVGFYIFIEARPKGSNFFGNIADTISRFFRSR